MNAKYIPSLLLAVTIGMVLLIVPFADILIGNRSPALSRANTTSLTIIPNRSTFDDFKDIRNVIDAFQSNEPYDVSICFCGFYADYIRTKLEERVATGEVTREQVDGFCPVLIQSGA